MADNCFTKKRIKHRRNLKWQRNYQQREERKFSKRNKAGVKNFNTLALSFLIEATLFIAIKQQMVCPVDGFG
jgi:hypothetical protein